MNKDIDTTTEWMVKKLLSYTNQRLQRLARQGSLEIDMYIKIFGKRNLLRLKESKGFKGKEA